MILQNIKNVRHTAAWPRYLQRLWDLAIKSRDDANF